MIEVEVEEAPVATGFVTEEPDIDHAETLLREAETLLRPDTHHAAILMTWTAVEAAMRVIARRHGVDPGSLSPHELIQTLREKGNLSEEQSDELDEFHTARNRIAQGLRALKMPLKQVYRLLEITRHLLDRRPDCLGSLSTLRDMVEPIIEDLSELPKQIQAASELLREILGTSAGEVSVEWDRATDWNNRTIVTLTLSDLFGKVMATLDLGELTDRTRLLLRLPGLWRDLLRIRCQQYEKDISELVAQFAGAA